MQFKKIKSLPIEPGSLDIKEVSLATNIVEADCNKILDEAKRMTKRYFIRPQHIFCANKEDILKALAQIGDANCSIYTLKNLEDHDDVHQLTNQDIIYYYDDGILYDKNRVKVLDYDLFIKHEEERKKINTDQVSDETFDREYDDRLTEIFDGNKESAINSNDEDEFNLTFEDINAYGEKLVEGKEKDGICCICGEEIDGYGNNAEPYKSGRCCDACNMKFVIPARLEQMNANKEK